MNPLSLITTMQQDAKNDRNTSQSSVFFSHVVNDTSCVGTVHVHSSEGKIAKCDCVCCRNWCQSNICVPGLRVLPCNLFEFHPDTTSFTTASKTLSFEYFSQLSNDVKKSERLPIQDVSQSPLFLFHSIARAQSVCCDC